MRKNKILILVFFFLYGCSEKYTPKPYGYFRIDFPEKQWVQTPDSLPYTFQMAGTAYIEHDPDPDAEKGWINLRYPQYNARIHLSYKTIKEDTSLTHYLDDCHHMAYTHTIKAESIHEKYFRKPSVFGLIYYIEGNTASSTQFFVTDSSRHFLRGALYFNQHPDKDSLAPVIQFLRQDIVQLIETIQFP
ncbi:gliding motility lipoprotein GldD [Odoribacter sp. Z80]|uniref:gliding motility lipoprotein GldD n=1 Tax=Odoribacter sp. Z80 TaxID=2304575 RepID=UPI001379DDE7|nr:gliding motility lipoprotein GldD [Odoribacter sp. Z80]NCE72897.1 gliding motility lipoprotein GldD [Odoribacter sp. Z80]